MDERDNENVITQFLLFFFKFWIIKGQGLKKSRVSFLLFRNGRERERKDDDELTKSIYYKRILSTFFYV